MQRYHCVKVVEAFKIESISAGLPSPLTTLGGYIEQEENMIFVLVSKPYMAKHKPKVGGYYVRYEDGYESFSPAAAFEKGYAIMPDGVGHFFFSKETYEELKDALEAVQQYACGSKKEVEQVQEVIDDLQDQARRCGL